MQCHNMVIFGLANELMWAMVFVLSYYKRDNLFSRNMSGNITAYNIDFVYIALANC